MSRRRNALLAAGFVSLRSCVALLASFYVTRLLVRSLGVDLYGVWLATGGLLGYAALADLGIFSVLSWLFAEADAQKDVQRSRSLVANGLLAGVVAGLAYGAAGFGLWQVLPRLVELEARELELLAGPYALMVIVASSFYPLRLFGALRAGKQDFGFLGVWQVSETLLNAALTYVLLRAGFGLYSIAVATVVPPTLGNAAAFLRSVRRDRELLRELPRPDRHGVRPILSSGTGSWLGTLGWQLAFATDGLIIAHLGSPELVPTFMITSRLGLTLMQFSWSLPDSASIGLAHLGAEGDRARTTHIVKALIRFHLLASGAIACAILAGNAGFVATWVGPELFGGAALNAIFALDVVLLSVTHAIVVPAAVLGNRVRVGAITLGNGLVHVFFAWLLGRSFGLTGVALATAVSALVTTIPGGMALLAERTDVTLSVALGRLLLPWAARLVPCAIGASAIGWAALHVAPPAGTRLAPLVRAVCGGALASVAYLYVMRGMMRELPLGARVTRLLSLVRLVPEARPPLRELS